MEFNENDFTDLTCIFFEIAQIEIEKTREKKRWLFDEPFDVLAISVLLGTYAQNSTPITRSHA